MTVLKNIVVDTNAVSELMNPLPNPAVQAWFDAITPKHLFLASTSLAELRVGIAIIPSGRRKRYLAASLDRILASFFEERVLSFDVQAAEKFSEIVSQARLRGKTIDIADGQIAAIASVHRYAVATRDVGPFLAAGVAVVNPWEK